LFLCNAEIGGKNGSEVVNREELKRALFDAETAVRLLKRVLDGEAGVGSAFIAHGDLLDALRHLEVFLEANGYTEKDLQGP
jgi:hypothetical protein